MTDPRVAALAEALHAERVGCAFSLHRCGVHDSQALRILAALPPDWCGHGKLIGDLMAAQRIFDGPQEADLARLRRIEEAARKMSAARDARLSCPDDDDDCGQRLDAAHDALRAALEEDQKE